MRYLIDGYNLMHALGLVPREVGLQGLEPARKRFLDHLSTLRPPPGDRLIVVFDGLHAPADAEDYGSYRGVKYVYSRDQNADDLIEDMLAREKQPRKLTVVTDDRRLQQAARHRSCRVSACLDFYEALAYPAAETQAEEQESEPRAEAPSREEVEGWLREFGLDGDDGVPW